MSLLKAKEDKRIRREYYERNLAQALAWRDKAKARIIDADVRGLKLRKRQREYWDEALVKAEAEVVRLRAEWMSR